MPFAVSMRWWLALAFGLVVAVTVFAVGLVVSELSRDAFRERAQELAAGSALAAAIAVADGSERGDLTEVVARTAAHRRLALFVFDREGALLTGARSRGIPLGVVPEREQAVSAALRGRRFVATDDAVGRTVVALPFATRSTGAILAYASHPDLAAGVGIVRNQLIQAGLFAVLLGGATGVLVATLIARRLRRIGDTAAAIERGDFTASIAPRFLDEVGTLGVTIDRMRERLRASFTRIETERDRLSRLLEQLHEGVLMVRRDLRVELANGEARALLGGRELGEGSPLPDPWDAPSLRTFAAALFEPDATIIEQRVELEDQSIAVVGVPPTPGSDAAVLVLTDISERERHERAEREFVANAAHELRTPLTTISGAVEALRSGAEDDPAERELFMGHIEREAGRLGRLVQTLLVLARAQKREESPRLEPIELRPLLEQIAADVRPAAGVEVYVDCPSGLEVLGERGLAEHALRNLAANAAQHTRHGRILLRASRNRTGVAIEVEDTGPGISREEQQRIFERFYRPGGRSAEGFGLGLALVRETVRVQGGEVELESTPGVGTTARIRLGEARKTAG